MNVVRYRNRKLYCTDLSRYVTLAELLQFVREGKSVQVVEHQTRNNITQKTLATAYALAGNINVEAIKQLIQQ